MVKRILAVMLVAVLLLAALFLGGFWLGNPFTARKARSEAAKYIEDCYAGLDLRIGTVTYNPEDGSYAILLESLHGVDTHFSLAFRGCLMYKDDYDRVWSGTNTMERFCREYEETLTPLVQAETDHVARITVLPEKQTNYGLEIDSAFDRALVQNVAAAIYGTGGRTRRTFLAC